MIKAVIFDLDDTLYNYNELNEQGINEICKYTCQNLKISKEHFYKAFDKAKKDVKSTLGNVASSHNRLLYCQKTLENLNENPFSIALEMYEVYWQYILKNMKLNDNVLEILEFSKQKKIKIGICTDLTVHIQHRKIRKLGIDKYIDAIVTSEEVGVEKPDFKMYNKFDKKEIFKFLVGGGTAVIIDFLVYKILMIMGIERTIAKTISFICGSIVGFIINKYWTFKSPKFQIKEILKYTILYIITAFINSQVNKYTLLLFGSEFFAFLCATGVSTILNFLGQKFLIFR